MSNEKEIADFERRTKRVFDDSVAAVDAATRSRLTQARYRALEERASPRDRGWRSALVPAGTVAATALVAWLVVWQSPPTSVAVQATPLADLEILLGEEDLVVVLAEWPERAETLLPPDRWEIHIEPGDSDELRNVSMRSFGNVPAMPTANGSGVG